MRAADDKAAARVEVEDRRVVDVLGRHHGRDHVLHQLLVDRLVAHVGAVLRADEHGVHAQRHDRAAVLLVLDRHLRLAVGAQPLARAVLAHLREAVAEARREHVRERHELGRLVGRVAKHVALVAGANLLERLGAHAVHALPDVGRLLLDVHEHLVLCVVVFCGCVCSVLCCVCVGWLGERARRGGVCCCSREPQATQAPPILMERGATPLFSR